MPRPRSTPCRSPGKTPKTPRSRARRSRTSSKPGSRRKPSSSATRPAMPRRRSPAPPRSTRRSTPPRIRPTPPWSRSTRPRSIRRTSARSGPAHRTAKRCLPPRLNHPAMQCKLSAGMDANNTVTGLHVRLSGQSILASVAPARMQNGRDPATFQGLYPGGVEGAFGYDIPNLLVDHAMRNPHVPAGFWRGVNNNQNAIFQECFVDELAHEAKEDLLAFRRKMMGKFPKHLAVLNAAAEKAGWGTPAPQGVFRGIAQQMGYGSYVAACAEISVEGGNKIKIHRIVGVTDCGHALNPWLIERQVTGSFVFGLSALFFGACTVKDGAIEQKNFDGYNVMRMREMPKVETVIAPSGGFWGGVGEPTIFVAAPAVLNAFFAATGKRIRSFPLKDHDIQFA